MIAILSDTDTALFYCTTTEWAFGPVIGNDSEDKSDENDPHARAKRFRFWAQDKVGKDLRSIERAELAELHSNWLEDNSPNGGRPCQHPSVEIERSPTNEYGVGEFEGRCTVCGCHVEAECYHPDDQLRWEAA